MWQEPLGWGMTAKCAPTFRARTEESPNNRPLSDTTPSHEHSLFVQSACIQSDTPLPDILVRFQQTRTTSARLYQLWAIGRRAWVSSAWARVCSVRAIPGDQRRADKRRAALWDNKRSLHHCFGYELFPGRGASACRLDPLWQPSYSMCTVRRFHASKPELATAHYGNWRHQCKSASKLQTGALKAIGICDSAWR